MMEHTLQTTLKIAVVQMQSGVIAADNIKTSLDYIQQAADRGAVLISLPEVVNLMQFDKEKAYQQTYHEQDDPGLSRYREAANKHNIWLHIGSMVMRNDYGNGDEKPFVNRSYIIDDKGEIRARYDKSHMFDVVLSDAEAYKESDSYQQGDKAVIVQSPWGKLGLTVCYDLRFAYLHRALAQKGADIIFSPAAFTRTTGRLHWHVLLRARAIEVGAWVVAANQGADHADGRQTYGHSLIVDPIGAVVLDAKMVAGVHVHSVDLGAVATARAAIPALHNDNIPTQTILV